MFGDGSNDGRERRDVGEPVLPRQLRAQAIQVDIFLWVLGVFGGFVVLYKDVCNVGATPKETLVFRRQVGIFLSARGGDGHRRGHRRGGHVGGCSSNCWKTGNQCLDRCFWTRTGTGQM